MIRSAASGFAGVDLRDAVLTLEEDDRRFAESRAEALQPPENLFLKRVAAAANGVEIELGQHAPCDSSETRRCNPSAASPSSAAGVEIHRAAHQLPLQRPALDAAAGERSASRSSRRPAARRADPCRPAAPADTSADG